MINRRNFIKSSALAGAGLTLGSSLMAQGKAAGKRVGIIGLDTSHSIAFAKALNDPAAGDKFGGYTIVAAYPKGSLDIQSSVDRIEGYTNDIRKLGVEIVDSIEALLTKVDVVMLETLGTAMHNAVNRQQGAGMVSAAAVTATCAKMINAPFPVPPPPPAPTPPPPPHVLPLPGPLPVPPSPAALIAAATNEGKTAIGILQAQTHGASADAAAAAANLQTLQQLAGGTPAPAPGPAPDLAPGPDPGAGPAPDPALPPATGADPADGDALR